MRPVLQDLQNGHIIKLQNMKTTIHKEVCPYCSKEINVSYGKQRCPECKKMINVFPDDTLVLRRLVDIGIGKFFNGIVKIFR